MKIKKFNITVRIVDEENEVHYFQVVKDQDREVIFGDWPTFTMAIDVLNGIKQNT